MATAPQGDLPQAEALGNPADVMVNHVLEIDESGAISLEALRDVAVHYQRLVRYSP